MKQRFILILRLSAHFMPTQLLFLYQLGTNLGIMSEFPQWNHLKQVSVASLCCFSFKKY